MAGRMQAHAGIQQAQFLGGQRKTNLIIRQCKMSFQFKFPQMSNPHIALAKDQQKLIQNRKEMNYIFPASKMAKISP